MITFRMDGSSRWTSGPAKAGLKQAKAGHLNVE